MCIRNVPNFKYKNTNVKMGEYPQESKLRLVQICLQQKGHGKQSPSAHWLRGTAVLMNFRLRPVYIFWHSIPQWHLLGGYLFIFLKFSLQHKPQ